MPKTHTHGASAMQTAQRHKLEQGLVQLKLPETLAEPLLSYASALLHWNQAFNLTAITNPDDVVTHHLLDALSIHHLLLGKRILDVGTGAGLPGIPLAIANPNKSFTLLDSNQKRIRFLRQICGTLQLNNVTPIHARIEDCPERDFTTITSRAFTQLGTFVTLTQPYCHADGQLLAMKGQLSADEQQTLPDGWQIQHIHQLHVPMLDAARCAVTLTHQA